MLLSGCGRPPQKLDDKVAISLMQDCIKRKMSIKLEFDARADDWAHSSLSGVTCVKKIHGED